MTGTLIDPLGTGRLKLDDGEAVLELPKVGPTGVDDGEATLELLKVGPTEVDDREADPEREDD